MGQRRVDGTIQFSCSKSADAIAQSLSERFWHFQHGRL
ncbi:hypothetical protein Z945_2787 [Sulfitobacter noctilucae]|nr:hypothetical protein Z945_2787 [Sulfitobacter noctilucae]